MGDLASNGNPFIEVKKLVLKRTDSYWKNKNRLTWHEKRLIKAALMWHAVEIFAPNSRMAKARLRKHCIAYLGRIK